MKILWLCNLILPQAGSQLGIDGIPKEGWVEGLLHAIEPLLKDNDIAVAFPVPEEHDGKRGTFKLSEESEKTFSYFCFYEDTAHPETLEPLLQSRMNRILDEYRPDVVHIFGTEYPHARAMASAACEDDFHFHPGSGRLFITFQGICSAIAADYMACLPDGVVSSATFRDTVKRDSIKQQQEKFRARAVNELEAVKQAGHIGGRTSFDRKWGKRFSPDAVYHHAGEIMRPVFYEPLPDDINRDMNTIFVSGADYPLKGFHILLNAVKDLNWPELKIRVAGQDIVTKRSLRDKVKISEYGRYLGSLIRDYGLEDKVTFLGRIPASQMREEYLKCGMYICPSTVENSPNSIVEASLCMAPVIAAKVGGIPDIIRDKKECLLYDCNARRPMEEVAALLRKCIESVLLDPEAALRRSALARERMLTDNDPAAVSKGIMAVYNEMCKEDA